MTNLTKPVQNNRILQLDGFRGVAILVVILFHYLNNQYSSMDPSKLNFIEFYIMKITSIGWIGVNLFFILSGFLIGNILLKNKEAINFIQIFYTRRLLRIVPIYYLLIIIYFFLTQTSIFNPSVFIFEKPIPLFYYFFFIQNFYMSYHGHFGPEALTPTWSLAVEEQFYLIMPLLVYFFQNKYIKYFIIGGLTIGPISRYLSPNWYSEYTLLSSRIDSPLYGFLLSYLLLHPKTSKYIQNNLSKIKFVVLILILFFSILYAFVHIGFMNHTIIGLVFMIFLLLCLQQKNGFMFNILTNKVLVNLGKYSYCIYLFHPLFNGLAHLFILNQKIPILNNSFAYVVTLFAFFMTYIFSYLSYKYFEAPLISFGHSFNYQGIDNKQLQL